MADGAAVGDAGRGTAVNLGRSPLMRAVLVRVNGLEHAVVVNMHHIVSDAWSLGVLVSEMGALYVEYVKGGPSTFEEFEDSSTVIMRCGRGSG